MEPDATEEALRRVAWGLGAAIALVTVALIVVTVFGDGDDGRRIVADQVTTSQPDGDADSDGAAPANTTTLPGLDPGHAGSLPAPSPLPSPSPSTAPAAPPRPGAPATTARPRPPTTARPHPGYPTTTAPSPTTTTAPPPAPSTTSAPEPSNQPVTRSAPAPGPAGCPGPGRAHEEWCVTGRVEGGGRSFTVRLVVCREQGGGSATLDFSNGQEVDFVVERNGRAVWTWSKGVAFTQATHSVNVPDGHCITWSTRWDGTDDAGNPVGAGYYGMKATSVSRQLRSYPPPAVGISVG